MSWCDEVVFGGGGQFVAAISGDGVDGEDVVGVEIKLSIVAEDYTGTGLAWGSAKGADLDWLQSVNKFLCKPDLEILIDGERFLQGKEKVHLHESSDRLIGKARKSFQKLGKKNKWKVVNANQPIDRVADEIWQLAAPLFARTAKDSETFTSWQNSGVREPFESAQGKQGTGNMFG